MIRASQKSVKNLGVIMGEDERCMNCGLNIEKDYILYINGTEFTFDSFECAINFVAPRCTHCNSIILGRGTKQSDDIFCSPQCRKEKTHSPTIP
jgi:hypothetical protein